MASNMQAFAGMMWAPHHVLMALLLVLLTPLLYSLWAVFVDMMWLTPRRIKRIFESQGITCLPYRFMSGNLAELGALLKEVHSQPMPCISHDISAYAIPQYYRWSKEYGNGFVYWQGCQARFFLTDLEDVKEVLLTKSTHFPRIRRRPDMVNLIDNGLLMLEGERWAFHRRTLNPGFFLEKLKAMVPVMAKCTMEMIKKWNSPSGKSDEVDMSRDLRVLSADIIAHTAFGSSYAEGKQIFELQQEQLRLAAQIASTVYIPGARFLPTAFNRHCWRIDNKIEELTLQMIEKRLQLSRTSHGDMCDNDLLGLMIDAMKNEGLGNGKKKMTMGNIDIVGECKTFFAAGHETTATFLSWTSLLLAIHPEWQERVREEVQAVCGASDLPAADSLHHLKLVSMVLNESLRLYPPAAVLTRKASKDMQIGKTLIPKDTVLVLPLIAFQHDTRYWGPDVHEFCPERFSEGAAKACQVPGAFIPFSLGPHSCIGQAFALLEAKVVISTVLRHYRIHVSPGYRHSPVNYLTLQPQFGVPLVLEKI